MMTLLIYMLVALGIAGLIFQRSKLLTIVIFFFVWTLMWNTHSADYASYKSIYMDNEFRDQGYSVLCMLGRFMGLNFFEFYLTVGGIAYCIYCRFIIRYADRCALVAALYMLFICYFDIVQFRNFVAFAMVLTVIPFLFSQDRKKIIAYCSVVMVASSIHITVIFYLVFAFLNRDVFRFENFRQYLIPLLILIVGFYLGVGMFESRMTTISNNYNSNVSAVTKLAILFLLIGNALFMAYWSKQRVELPLTRSQEIMTIDPKLHVLFFNVAMILLFPIAIRSTTIFRLYKYIAIINFAYISNKFVALTNFKIIPQTIVIVLYGATYLALFFYVHIAQFIPIVMIPLFTRNKFWVFLT